MSVFNHNRPTGAEVVGATHQGGTAYKHTTKQELLILASNAMFSGKDLFYENADEQLNRFRKITREVLDEPDGPEFVAALAKYSRNLMYLRTLPACLVAELFCKASRDGNKANKELNQATHFAHQAAKWVWLRGDEPIDTISYLKFMGEKVKSMNQLKRAVRDFICSLSDYQILKYMSHGKTFSLPELAKVSHPKFTTEKHRVVIKYLVKGAGSLSVSEKGIIPDILQRKETATWERIVSSEGSTPAAWTKAVEVMPYEATLKNLGNLVQHCGDDALKVAAARLTNKKLVERSFLFPYRYYSAYLALCSSNSTPRFLVQALSDALDISCEKYKGKFDGNTLLLIDVSSSMGEKLSVSPRVPNEDINKYLLNKYLLRHDNAITRRVAAASIGAILAKDPSVDMYLFDTRVHHATNLIPSTPAISIIEWVKRTGGGGTSMGSAITATAHLGNYKRIVIITDEQSQDDAWTPLRNYLNSHKDCMAFIVNVAGYAPVSVDAQHRQIIRVGGYSDRVLDWILLQEKVDPVKEIVAYAFEKELVNV